MLKTLAVANYRSINKLVVPLDRLNMVTGPNGSGKSNLYRALRLLAETAQGGVINALAREGGLDSTFWAGPETISRRMHNGEVPVEPVVRQGVKRLRLGFAGEDFSYAISLGLPEKTLSYFALDPEVKKECIWAGHVYRPASLLVQRSGPMVRARDGRNWDVLAQHTPNYHSLFDQVGSLRGSPEVLLLRESIRGWRFYDHFRSDVDAPVRQPQLGTRTPVLHHDGRDLAAALQTIREIGDVLRQRTLAPQVVEIVFEGWKHETRRQLQTLGDTGQEPPGQRTVRAIILLFIGNQRAVVPDRHTVTAPVAVERPTRQLLAGVPLALAEVHQTLGRIVLAHALEQLGG